MIKEMTYRGLRLIVDKKNVKRLSIKIKNNEIYVSVPLLITNKQIEELIDEYYEWITKKLTLKKISVSYGNPLYITGQKVELIELDATRSKIEVYDEKIFIYGPSLEARKKAFDKYCEKILLETFSGFDQFNVEIKFKNYKGKWGCCYPDKKLIYYNYHLACLPLEAIEYVYYHEMAHLKVKNHQKEFYKEVERLLPGYRKGLKMIKNYNL